MPIVREKAFHLTAEEFSFRIAYTSVDVERCLVALCRMLHANAGDDMIEMQWKEMEIREFFVHGRYPTPFNEYPAKVAASLSNWAFRKAVDKGYLVQSVADKDGYLISESIKDKARRKAKS